MSQPPVTGQFKQKGAGLAMHPRPPCLIWNNSMIIAQQAKLIIGEGPFHMFPMAQTIEIMSLLISFLKCSTFHKTTHLKWKNFYLVLTVKRNFAWKFKKWCVTSKIKNKIWASPTVGDGSKACCMILFNSRARMKI
mgnify:CR=1 FL=1